MNITNKTRKELRRRRDILVAQHEKFLAGEILRHDFLAHVKASDAFARNVAVDLMMGENGLIEDKPAQVIEAQVVEAFPVAAE